jgi:predicted Rossmann-fold nucleotide-binding protein
MLTWLQLGLHSKPIGLLNYKGFFDLLLKQLDLMVEKGFLRPSNKELMLVNESYEALLNTLSKIKIEPDTKWFTDRNLS